MPLKFERNSFVALSAVWHINIVQHKVRVLGFDNSAFRGSRERAGESRRAGEQGRAGEQESRRAGESRRERAGESRKERAGVFHKSKGAREKEEIGTFPIEIGNTEQPFRSGFGQTCSGIRYHT
jgi:hypothetical protein